MSNKNEADLARIKIPYYNSTTNKTEEFKIYDYLEHLKTYGFVCKQLDLGFTYEIKTVSGKIQKNYPKQINSEIIMCR